MSSSPPTQLGKYQIIREIARSNDIVYEGYDSFMNRRVAVKELAFPNGLSEAQREDRIQRFHREARAAGSLSHPNIMTVYEVNKEGDRHFIAMEYLDGSTLRSEIDSQGFLPVQRACEIAIAMLRGLEFAHMNGVVHRDIKPDNIQILSDGRIKITDFGIARLTFEPNLTMDGQVFGTPSYMSPEQVVGRDIDARSDIFSVGIVLYEMLGGQKPFQGDSVVSITFAIMNKEPAPLQNAPYGVAQVVQKALDKSPALRYTSAAEMLTALENALANPQQTGNYSHDPYSNNQSYNTLGYGANPMAGLPPVAFTPPPTNAGPVPYGVPPILQGQSAPPPMMNIPQIGMGYVPPTIPAPAAFQSQGGFVPPAPAYYPPPPRQPLLKPETRFFLGRLLFSVVLIGLLFALLLVVINGISGVWLNSQAANSTNARIARNENAPVSERIAAAQRMGEEASTEEQRKASKRQLSELYKQQGDQLEVSSTGGDANAENSYRLAVEQDPTDPLPYYSLAKTLKAKAMSLSVPNDRARVLNEVAANFEAGLTYDRDQARQKQYQNQLAETLYQQAIALFNSGNRFDARDKLYRARRIVADDPKMLESIEALLEKLS